MRNRLAALEIVYFLSKAANVRLCKYSVYSSPFAVVTFVIFRNFRKVLVSCLDRFNFL